MGISHTSSVGGRPVSIGRAFSNRSYENDLPGNMTVLYELPRMDPDDIEHGIEPGAITPEMTIKQARDYAQPEPPARATRLLGGAISAT